MEATSQGGGVMIVSGMLGFLLSGFRLRLRLRLKGPPDFHREVARGDGRGRRQGMTGE